MVGKPATTADVYSPSSYMSATDLNASLVAAYSYNQFKTGLMFWQFSSDPNGTIVAKAMSGLNSLLKNSSTNNTSPINTTTLTSPVKFGRVTKILALSSTSWILLSLGFPINGVNYNIVSYSAWTYSYGPI